MRAKDAETFRTSVRIVPFFLAISNNNREAVQEWQFRRQHLPPRGGELEELSAINFREFLFATRLWRPFELENITTNLGRFAVSPKSPSVNGFAGLMFDLPQTKERFDRDQPGLFGEFTDSGR